MTDKEREVEMDYNFSNNERNKRSGLNALQDLKKEYQNQQMSEKQKIILQQKMEEAKMMNKKERNNNMIKKVVATVAVAAAGFVILPNVSSTIAYGMSQIPVIGSLVDIVTFREYQYEDATHRADMDIPELIAKEDKLQQATDSINAEIQTITKDLIAQFEASMLLADIYQ